MHSSAVIWEAAIEFGRQATTKGLWCLHFKFSLNRIVWIIMYSYKSDGL